MIFSIFASIFLKKSHRIKLFDLSLHRFVVLGKLLVTHLFEDEVSQSWLLVQLVDLVPDHLIVLVPLLDGDLEESFYLLVKLAELFDIIFIDSWYLLVVLRVVFLDPLLLVSLELLVVKS